MGSLENGHTMKKALHPQLRSSTSFLQRPRSRFARFLLFEKVDYLQWICTVAVFLFVIVLFQMFLPGSVMDNVSDKFGGGEIMVEVDWSGLKELGGLDFGEGIRFDSSQLIQKFQMEKVGAVNSTARPGVRSGIRKPQLALVFADLLVEPKQLLMVSVAAALKELGYAITVYSFEDGPVQVVWESIDISVTILEKSNISGIAVNWLNYDGVLVNSLEARDIFSRLVQEPFKSLPVIWTIHEEALAIRSREYTSNGQSDLLGYWKQAFNRATVVVFPNHFLPMIYSAYDAGNYYVIPGSPNEAMDVDNFVTLHNKDSLRANAGYDINDFVIVIVGSQFMYSGLWLEQAFVLQALFPLLSKFASDIDSRMKVRILSGNSSSNYTLALEGIAVKLGYPNGTVEHIGFDGDMNIFLGTADLVVHGSFLEEQSFPLILIRAMCYGKPIIAPDLAIIKKYVDDRVNGFLFSKDKIEALTQVLFQAVSKGKLSPLARNIASMAKVSARNLMVRETIEGYASLLENILKFHSEVAAPKGVAVITPSLKKEWQWHLFKKLLSSKHSNKALQSYQYLDSVEEFFNHTNVDKFGAASAIEEAFSYTDWQEEKQIEMLNVRKRREDEELKDRSEQARRTWEEVYRNAKRADRARNNLHERDDRELERTAQPLCIYEPYFGEGTWPFLHHNSLYRGIGLSTKGRRPRSDDVDAPSRLSLLSNPYYRDVLGEYGAFFSIANRIDRIHKNAWIGFQSWRATAGQVSLSKHGEHSLLDAIQGRKHGDALYFWVGMDKDPRNPLQQEFWSFCDAINAGNCRFAVSEALHRMYGLKKNLNSLPPMPISGDTWSVMHSWALPTRSFVEFVMFSRMFVDALDAHMYDEHHQSGYCYLSLSKDRHCYSRVLELLVNVWAYHSAKRMVYVNPETGVMQEQHKLKNRKGQMWVRWFTYATIKSMDEDLAEEADSDNPIRRWLWPSTGEVYWQGIYEREQNLRHRQKEKKKQQSKDKISRMRKRVRQKTIGKYIKPPPEEARFSNSTEKINTSLR